MRKGQRSFIGDSSEPRYYGDLVAEPMESGKSGENIASFKNILLGQGSGGLDGEKSRGETNSEKEEADNLMEPQEGLEESSNKEFDKI